MDNYIGDCFNCSKFEPTTQTDILVFASVITVLTTIGICGNILCVIVFTRKVMKTPGVRLLRYLAVTDLFTLMLCYSKHMLSDMSFDLRTTNGLYKTVQPILLPMTWTMRVFETNLTVLISLQRALALTKPLFVEKYITSSTVTKTLIATAVFSLVFSVPSWIAYGPHTYFQIEKNVTLSDFKNSYLYSFGYLIYFVLICHCFIPITTLTICNISFILARRKMAAVLGRPRDKGSTKMTAIISAITTVAVITHIVLAIGKISPELCHISNVGSVFVVFKLSTNFIFYTTFGRSFRRTLIALFKCKNGQPTTTQTIPSTF